LGVGAREVDEDPAIMRLFELGIKFLLEAFLLSLHVFYLLLLEGVEVVGGQRRFDLGESLFDFDHFVRPALQLTVLLPGALVLIREPELCDKEPYIDFVGDLLAIVQKLLDLLADLAEVSARVNDSFFVLAGTCIFITVVLAAGVEYFSLC